MDDHSSAPAMRALLRATRGVHNSLDLEETLETITRGVIEATVFDVAVVNIRREDGGYECVAVAGPPDARATLLGSVGAAPHWQALITQSRAWGELRFIHHDDPLARDDSVTSWRPSLETSDDPERWHPDDMLFAPLTNRDGDLIGTLCVDVPRTGRLPDEQQRELLTLFAHHASVAIEHALLYAELQRSHDLLVHAANHDALTGLYNRSVLNAKGPELAAVPGRRLAVVMIDLDRFKQVNDSGGHHAGDQLLTVVSRRMQACVRESDLLVRTGGDEFVVTFTLQPGANVDAVVADLVARLKTTIEAPLQLGTESYSVGASIGSAVASTPTDFDRLLIAADAAMYDAKKTSLSGALAG